MIGEKVRMELVGEIRFWVPKRSGTERLRTKGLRIRIRGLEENARLQRKSIGAGRQNEVGRHGSARTKRYANWFRSAGQRKITRLKD